LGDDNVANKNKRSNFENDIIGIILITIGILIYISIFIYSSSGILGKFVKTLTFAIIGLGAYFFPALIIFIGIIFILRKGKINFGKRFFGILLFLVNTLLTIQMFNMKKYYNNSLWLGITAIYNSKSVFHGGIISYLLIIPIYKLFGSINSYIIFTAIYIISLIIIFQKSIHEVCLSMLNKFKNKKAISNKEEFLENNLPLKELKGDKNEYLKKVNNKIKIIDFMKSTLNMDSSNMDSAEKSDELALKTTPTESKLINQEVEQEIIKNYNSNEIKYEFPTIDLLNENNLLKLNKEDKRELIDNANKLEETLMSFGVEAKVVQVTKGPSVTRYELQPNAGVKVSKIVNLSDDIALNLASSGVRIEAPIPGKAAVGIEVPNKELSSVFLREVIESAAFSNSVSNLAFCLGKDIAGNCVISDLTKMPHLLIAGATGSGKSVCINTLVISLLYKYPPEKVKFLMIDPKVVELNVYNGIPHLLIPVVTDPKKAAGALNWAVNEMTRRYKSFAENNVRNIEGYNDLIKKGKNLNYLPLIVIIIDELADLMMVCPNDIEDYIGRLAQMARAAGMHLVIATQRPSVDVITGVIKANIPSRISFSVSSQIDSRTILDMAGAEKLLGKGDMLFYPSGEAKPIRIQGAFISEDEVEKVVTFIKNNHNSTEYENDLLNEINTTQNEESDISDELLDEAINIVTDVGQASTSLLQRKLRIGYNRAARIIEQMEQKGVISGKDGSRPRQILKERDSDSYYREGNNN
jgi:DNA segregation ATPase FtsK/SpoIIIE, S-DNA-T family